MFSGVFRAVKHYTLEHSVVLPAGAAGQVWALWSDINNWPRWDKGLENCEFSGGFEVGQSFSLRPKGAPMALTTTLLEVEEGKRFKDRTEMPLGTIHVTHELEPYADSIKLTHRIDAEIYEDKIPAFESTLWAKWQTGLPNSVQNIASIVEESLGLSQESSSAAQPSSGPHP